MEASKAERLEEAIVALNAIMALTRDLDLHDSTEFLAMARLNLQIDLNGITEAEFRSFCVALEDETQKQRRTPALRRSARRRHGKAAQGEEAPAVRTRRGAEPGPRHASRTRIGH